MTDFERKEPKEAQSDEHKPKKSFLSEAIGTVVFVIVVMAVAFFIVTFIGQRTIVSGSSMEATLSDGDSLIIDKISYRVRDPQRYDIIVFPYEQNEDTFYIKRIIGLPGETVQIDLMGNIYIDNEMLTEDYGLARITNPGVALEPVMLSMDEYFVMGDNRNNSHDSRMEDVGPIKRDEIVGRAFVRIYPFDRVGILKHGE